MATEIVDDMAGNGQPKAAVVIIIGEPFSVNDRTLILEEIVKGEWPILSIFYAMPLSLLCTVSELVPAAATFVCFGNC
jgi:hypothetical protein